MVPATSSVPITRSRFEPRAPDGTHVNAVYGFCNMLWKLLKEMKPDERPTHLAVVFDKSGEDLPHGDVQRLQGASPASAR